MIIGDDAQRISELKLYL